MALDDLRDYLEVIDRTGELVRVRGRCGELEMAEIADRTMKLPGGGPALLFERAVLADGRESRIPVAINIFGSWKRMTAALGVESLEEHATRIQELLKPDVPKGLLGQDADAPEADGAHEGPAAAVPREAALPGGGAPGGGVRPHDAAAGARAPGRRTAAPSSPCRW